MNKRSRKNAEQRGRRAETLAAWLLRLKGYKILEMRHKTPYGEIDIIAAKGDVLAIVEVKQRQTMGLAIEALHSADLSRIQEAAYHYQSKHLQHASKDIRFDAVYVTKTWRAKHMQDEWRGY